MGLNISDMLSIKRENERLIFDMNLLEHSLLEQKKYNSLITTNEQLFKKQRHDLRHQLVAIKGLANTENKQLNEYLDSLIHSIPSAPASYCHTIVPYAEMKISLLRQSLLFRKPMMRPWTMTCAWYLEI